VKLHDNTILITSDSTTIGLAISESFLKLGNKVRILHREKKFKKSKRKKKS